MSESIFDVMNRRFISGNSVSVERAHINLNEWNSIRQQLEQAEARADSCEQQAKIWKQEARTQSAIVAEIYQELTGKTGEPGDWHGARPLRPAILRKQAEAVVKASSYAHEELFQVGALCAESGAAMSAVMDYAQRLRAKAEEQEKGDE